VNVLAAAVLSVVGLGAAMVSTAKIKRRMPGQDKMRGPILSRPSAREGILNTAREREREGEKKQGNKHSEREDQA